MTVGALKVGASPELPGAACRRETGMNSLPNGTWLAGKRWTLNGRKTL